MEKDATSEFRDFIWIHEFIAVHKSKPQSISGDFVNARNIYFWEKNTCSGPMGKHLGNFCLTNKLADIFQFDLKPKVSMCFRN